MEVVEGVVVQPSAKGVICRVIVFVVEVKLFKTIAIGPVIPVAEGLVGVTPLLLATDQSKVVPTTFGVKAILEVPPLQSVPVKLVRVKEGVGLTTTEVLTNAPGHPPADEVMSNVTVCEVLVRLISEILIGLPVPPVEPLTFPVLVRVQLKVVPMTSELNTILAFEPEHILGALLVTVTTGLGFTDTTPVTGVPLQTAGKDTFRGVTVTV